MRYLLAGALLTLLLPLTGQEKIYQITNGLQDQKIHQVQLVDHGNLIVVNLQEEEKSTIKLYHFHDGKEIELPKALMSNNIQEIAFHPEKPVIAITSSSRVQRTKIIDLAKLKVINQLPIVEKGNILFSPDGRHFGMLEDKTILLFDWQTGKESHKLDMSSGGWIPYHFQFSPDSRLIAFLASRYDEELQTRLQKVFLWDIVAGRFSEIFTATNGFQIRDLIFSGHSGGLFVIERHNDEDANGNRLVYWKENNFKAPFSKDLGRIQSMAISNDGNLLATLEYSYSPLVIHNLLNDKQDVFFSPSPSDYNQLMFSEDDEQILMLGKRLTNFSLQDHSFRTLYAHTEYDDIQHVIFAKDSKSLVFSNNYYSKPSLTKLNHSIDLSKIPVALAEETYQPEVVLEETVSEGIKIEEKSTNTLVSQSTDCGNFRPYKLGKLEVVNKISYTPIAKRQRDPYGLKEIAFNTNEDLMATYVPSNESLGLYNSELILWDLGSRCRAVEFKNQRIEEETYLILTQPANSIAINGANTQIFVQTKEHIFQFDIGTGQLESANLSSLQEESPSIKYSIDGLSNAYIDEIKQQIVIEGQRSLIIAPPSLDLQPQVFTWCFGDRILAVINRDEDSFVQQLSILDLEENIELEKIDLNGNEITQLEWLHQKRQLVTVERSGGIKFWSLDALLEAEITPDTESLVASSAPQEDVDDLPPLSGNRASSLDSYDNPNSSSPSNPLADSIVMEEMFATTEPMPNQEEAFIDSTARVADALTANESMDESTLDDTNSNTSDLVAISQEEIQIAETATSSSLSAPDMHTEIIALPEEQLINSIEDIAVDPGRQVEAPIDEEKFPVTSTEEEASTGTPTNDSFTETPALEDEVNTPPPVNESFAEAPAIKDEMFTAEPDHDSRSETSGLEDEVFAGEPTANDLVMSAENDLTGLLLNQEFFRAERAAFKLLYKDAANYDARIYLTLAFLYQGKFGKAKLTWYKHKDKTLTNGDIFTDRLMVSLDHLLDNNISHRDARKFKALIQN